MALDTVPDILDDIREGKMVILMDDEDRENEGDLVIAAEKVTPKANGKNRCTCALQPPTRGVHIGTR